MSPVDREPLQVGDPDGNPVELFVTGAELRISDWFVPIMLAVTLVGLILTVVLPLSSGN